MKTGEIMELTGLPEKRAALARRRRASLPFISEENSTASGSGGDQQGSQIRKSLGDQGRPLLPPHVPGGQQGRGGSKGQGDPLRQGRTDRYGGSGRQAKTTSPFKDG